MEKQEIKQLENQFTSPEQSQRLLEIGLPASSSDCFISFPDIRHEEKYSIHVIYNFSEGAEKNIRELIKGGTYIPCWSYGRLQEIYDICRICKIRMTSFGYKGTQVEKAMYALAALVGVKMIDFTKLEDYR